MTAHVGVVGEVLAADRARELIADGRGARGRAEATRLGAVGFQGGTAGVSAGTCVAPVGVEIGAGVGTAQVDGQLGVGGEVARAEGTGAVRLGVLATNMLLQVSSLGKTAGTQRARQSTAAVDTLVAPPVGQRRKTLVTFVARVRLGTYTRPSCVDCSLQCSIGTTENAGHENATPKAHAGKYEKSCYGKPKQHLVALSSKIWKPKTKISQY